MEPSYNVPKDINTSAKGVKRSLNGTGTFIEKAKDFLIMNEDHQEGRITKVIEDQTSKIPSGVYLALAIGSMALSAVVAVTSKRRDNANFFGLWAPSLLLMGLYNKIVKTHGSDRQHAA